MNIMAIKQSKKHFLYDKKISVVENALLLILIAGSIISLLPLLITLITASNNVFEKISLVLH